jgi:pantoate kinase
MALHRPADLPRSSADGIRPMLLLQRHRLREQPKPEQLFMNYAASFPRRTSLLTKQTFEHVKRMISYIAIDVHLDMTVDQVKWLSNHYFAGLNELTNLKALCISLSPRLGSEHNSCKRQLARGRSQDLPGQSLC